MAETVQSIGTKLWAMANELRGTMDASEFKTYILGFMFYRYLSEHQETFIVENGLVDVEDGQDFDTAYAVAVKEEGLDIYLKDISASLGYAIAPEYTWSTITNKVNDNQIQPSDFQSMFDSFESNVGLNADAEVDFAGLFSNINLGDPRLGSSTTERAKTLSRIVNLIGDINYKAEDGRDILGEIYEYLIGEFAANAGKKGGEFYTPHEVSKVLAKIVTHGREVSNEAFSVYDPTMGSGSLLLTVKNELPGGERPGAIKFYGQEKNTTTYNLGRMNLMMHNVAYANMEIRNADTLELDWPDGLDDKGIDHPRSFDAVVANPPYSANWDNHERKLGDPRFTEYGKLAPKSKADFAFVLHSLYHLNSEGTMAIVLPHGVLFRGGAEGAIRKVILEKNLLDAVIGLPANMFYGTSIPTIILVFKKNRPEGKGVLFIDASKEFIKEKKQNRLGDENIDKIVNTWKKYEDVEKYAHIATMEEIIENEYNLNIPRYVDTFEEEEEIDIEEVLRQLAKDNEEIAKLEKEIEEQLKLLGVSI